MAAKRDERAVRAAGAGQGRAEARRRLAIAGARAAARALSQKGVTLRVIGSLATGDFRVDSDVDFLVTDCPRRLKYRIEGIVEDCLGGLPFDVLYLDEVASYRLGRVSAEAIDARHLR